jgi:hypothetical protein
MVIIRRRCYLHHEITRLRKYSGPEENMKSTTLWQTGLAAIISLFVLSIIPRAFSQNINWGPATGITGDANLSVAGTYFDAFIPNTALGSPLTFDGVTFNVDNMGSSTSTSDGIITCSVTSGTLNDYNGNSFPSGSPSSPAFAAIMNAGGIYENGGAGAGTVTISNLTPGVNYSVQVFNYANDGDPGATALSGSTSVTLTNLPNASGPGTFGQFATGTFTAGGSTETFNWNGAGSAYTVLGAISVRSIPANLPPTISEDTTPGSVTAYQSSTTTFMATFGGTPPITNQWQISTNGGVTFTDVPGATNSSLTVTNSTPVTNVEYYLLAANAYGTNHSSPATLTVLPLPPQTISWGPATGITGDQNLSTNGTYFDAFIPNTTLGAPLTADGVTFNVATSSSGSGGTDGTITFNIISGNNNTYDFTTFPTTAPSSPAFAAVMNAGGTYENGGAGQGIVIISGLTVGHAYSIQVFNYANDGDFGLTTMSGPTPVELSNLPGSGGQGTDGEFATGTFTASATNESFYWTGDGSGFTVLGAMSVFDVTSLNAPVISLDTTPPAVTNYIGTTTTFTASFIGARPITNQWKVSTDGGSTFTSIPGATNITLTVTNSQLVTNVLYYLQAINAYGSNHSTAAALTVIPVPVQNIFWDDAQIITGDDNLLTNGIYFDAMIPLLPAPLTADGVTFNAPTSDSDGTISYVVTSGSDQRYDNNTLFSGGSAAFNAIMNAGGTYETGGAGAGTITISGLTSGHIYQVQIFNYAGDGDTGLTTFSGAVPVTLSTMVGNVVTQNQFATGSFAANGTNESFNWKGDGSAYTVFGAISVFDVTGIVSTNATRLILQKNGGQLQLTWPPDHTGWRLQEQINSLIGTNWVDIAGATNVNSLNLPITTTNRSAFFRLVYP